MWPGSSSGGQHRRPYAPRRDDYWTVIEAADVLGESERNVWRRVKADKLAAWKWHGVVLVLRVDVAAVKAARGN